MPEAAPAARPPGLAALIGEPKIDCHVHVFDPARFPYAADAAYRPAGGERATAALLAQVHDAYGVGHALLVGPNSGYGEDNRCLLDAIAGDPARFRGVAVVADDTGRDELLRLKAAGVVGVAFNATFHGTAHYARTAPLLRRLRDLDLFLQLQVEADQLLDLEGLVRDSGVRLLVDHCGRPVPEAGLGQAGFQALLRLARDGRAACKLSGLAKASRQPYPFADLHGHVRALLDAFTPDRCVWGSDWPFLRAPDRTDFGPLLALAGRLLPDAADRRRVMHDTPARLFGFGAG
jgi:predicted TIM-barrel fold metal-dependent hydrolase